MTSVLTKSKDAVKEMTAFFLAQFEITVSVGLIQGWTTTDSYRIESDRKHLDRAYMHAFARRVTRGGQRICVARK